MTFGTFLKSILSSQNSGLVMEGASSKFSKILSRSFYCLYGLLCPIYQLGNSIFKLLFAFCIYYMQLKVIRQQLKCLNIFITYVSSPLDTAFNCCIKISPMAQTKFSQRLQLFIASMAITPFLISYETLSECSLHSIIPLPAFFWHLIK